MIISKPKPGEYADYCLKYLNNVPNDINLIEHLVQNLNALVSLIESVPENKLLYCYEKDKWTIKEVLLHIIDTERVFSYRALAYARGDKTKLPGFHENLYAQNSNANDRSIADIIDELKSVRLSTISLFKTFSYDQFAIIGKTNETDLSVVALAFLILGHALHHVHIIQDKYLAE